jgi:branched-chain amino acid transport system permease protein
MDHILTVAGINAIGAWAVGIAIRSGQLSVGHAALAGIAGYTAGLITRGGGNFWLAVLVAIVVAAIVGALLSALTQRLDHLFLALATLIFGEIAAIVATDLEFLGGAAGLPAIPFETTLTMVAITILIIVLAEVFIIRGSRAEVQMQLLAHNPSLVDLSGSSARRQKVIFFTLSAAAVGLSGAFHAHEFGVVQPRDLQFAHSLDFVVYAVVGGAHSGYGAIVGAIVLTLGTEFISIPGITRPVIFGAILLFVLLVRDRGIFARIPLRLGAARAASQSPDTAGGVSG